MEFNEKLQELRKQKGLTQEELANALYVSRTAVSKWESGRGYPNIDSLKAIAKFFSVSIDELLTGGEALSIAEEDNKQKQQKSRSLIFSLLDLSCIMAFFLPLFREKAGETVHAVSLLRLNGIAPYLNFAYWIIIIGTIATGAFFLVLQDRFPALKKYQSKVSLVFNALGVLLLIISSQPYAAALLFVFLIIKLLFPGKRG